MKMFASALIATSLSLMLLPNSTRSEDYLNVGGWYEGLYTKFKPSCALRALEITHEHFGPVDKKIGRNVIVFDFRTGEWDQIVYFPVIFTGEGYEWVKEKEWWSTFIEQEGGQEQADAVFGEYLDCLAVRREMSAGCSSNRQAPTDRSRIRSDRDTLTTRIGAVLGLGRLSRRGGG